MPSDITIEELSLAGFRAFLMEQTFKLRHGERPKSLAVFAPNAMGKSSLVDALEFFFSDEGTLKRLGKRRSGTQAGKEALEHVKAEDAGIIPKVSVTFHNSTGQFGDTRVVTQSDAPKPDAAMRVLQARKLDFIIRGYELRRFVEDQTPLERYQEVSEWFGLSFLVEIQKNVRTLRLRINRYLEDDKATAERLKDLSTATGGVLTAWNEEEVLGWINQTQIYPIEPALTLSVLDKNSQNYRIVQEREEEEKKRIGLATLEQVINGIKVLYVKDAPQPDGSTKEAGAIIEFRKADKVVQAARVLEKEERAKSEKAVFREVWEIASKLFENPEVTIDVCPVCDTLLDQTAKGSREHITLHLQTEIGKLGAYREAYQALQNAIITVNQKLTQTRSAATNLQTSLKAAGFEDEAGVADAYDLALEAWKEGQDTPDATAIKGSLSTLIPKVEEGIHRIKTTQDEYTYGKALSKIDELINLKTKLEKIEKTRAELGRLHVALTAQETFIASEIRTYVQSIIDTLQTRINSLYCSIHLDEVEAPAILLELDIETKQPQLNMLVDFAPNRLGVVPSGYLSDSQLHTLALSLRMAAIQLLNKNTPFIVLDDIVTAYDADHRRAIASMLSNHFNDFQILVVTLDERFFAYLKDVLPEATWDFKRITTLDPDFGPRFHDHKIPDALIDDKLTRNESAAKEIRQAEEEWLLNICRDFGVDVRIREVHKPYSYERSELAIALHRFLRDKGIAVPPVFGISNPFLLSLQRGEVENFGSHFQEDPSAFSSLGDERLRWGEFKIFRDMFTCPDPDCGQKRFKRPTGMENPVCRSCETSFTFPESSG